VNPEEELLEAMRLNGMEKYTEACELFVKNEGLLDTPLLLSHFALSKVGSEGEAGDLERAQALCIKSLKSDITNPDIYFNLAKIYLISQKKELAVKAIEKGLKYADTHAGLLRLQESIGERRDPAIGFLSREAALNKSIGKMTYKGGKPKDNADND
jgi:tetratricopeptide (TPR) repeat protein